MAMSAGPGAGSGAGPGAGGGDMTHGPPGADDERLPCGRTLREVWDAWDEDGAAGDPHYASCPHCTAALDGLRVLDDFVRSARDADEEPEAGRDGQAGTGAEAVTARVMDIVRRELRPGRSLPLGDPDEDAWIVEAAAARTFRSAAETLPGVRAGSCRVTPLETAAAATRGRYGQHGARGPLRVRIEVMADLSRSVPEVAEAVRARVAAAAREAVGLDVRAVDVAVIDVLDDDPRGGAVRDDAADGGREAR